MYFQVTPLPGTTSAGARHVPGDDNDDNDDNDSFFCLISPIFGSISRVSPQNF